MLKRIPDSDIMPFEVYEILFLEYIEGSIAEEELEGQYRKGFKELNER